MFLKSESRKKNCLILGGATGFGYHLTKAFSEKYNIIILGRSKSKFLKVKKKIVTKNKIFFLKNDLSNLNDIKKFRQKNTKLGDIDVIIFNAGTIENKNKNKKISSIYKVNYLSNFFIINFLKQKITKDKKKVIIINISSKFHKFANLNDISFLDNFSNWTQYANSKLMMLLFLNKLKRLHKNKIAILNFDPGWMVTNFGNNQKNFLRKILNIIRAYFAKDALFQEIQAKKLFNISQTELRKFDGKFFDFYGINKASNKSTDIFLQNKLWNKTDKFLRNSN